MAVLTFIILVLVLDNKFTNTNTKMYINIGVDPITVGRVEADCPHEAGYPIAEPRVGRGQDIVVSWVTRVRMVNDRERERERPLFAQLDMAVTAIIIPGVNKSLMRKFSNSSPEGGNSVP